MEFENLKSIWKEYTTQGLDEKQLDEVELRNLLKGKTQNAISKINQSIIFEVGLLFFFTLGISIAAFFQEDFEKKIIFAVIILGCIFSGIFYWIKYQRINKVLIASENLKKSLEKLIQMIHFFLKIYFYGSISLAPLGFISGYLYGVSTSPDKQIDLYNPRFLLLGFAFALLFTIVLYPLLKWYIKKLYGNYLQELKKCLEELKNEG